MTNSSELNWDRAEPVVLHGGTRHGWAYSRESALTMARAESATWRGWPWIPTGETEQVRLDVKGKESIHYTAEIWRYRPELDGIAKRKEAST